LRRKIIVTWEMSRQSSAFSYQPISHQPSAVSRQQK
jgi:hypothetical protein